MTMRFLKNILCILALPFAFFLGFYQGLRWHEGLTHRAGVYVYDTQQKLDAYYKMMEQTALDGLGLFSESPIEDPRVKEIFATLREERPLAVIGPLAVFLNNESGEYSVREKPLYSPLVTIRHHKQSKRLQFNSSIEQGWAVPQFGWFTSYSEDGVYERGIFFVHKKNGMPTRTYFDEQGTGIFDVMQVYEDGVQTTYCLTDFSWEQVDEQPYTEYLKKFEKGLLENALLFRSGNQAERGTSNKNYDVNVEQIDINIQEPP